MIQKSLSTIFLLSLLIFFGACSQVKLLEKDIEKDIKTAGKTSKEENGKGENKGVKMLPHPVENSGQNSGKNSEREKISQTITPSQEISELNEDQTDDNEKPSRKAVISKYCEKLQKSFTKYGWGKMDCESHPWQFVRTSVNGDPLLWRTFGTKAPEGNETETTIIMCGVHGDEITPIKFCFDTIQYLNQVSQGKITDPHTQKLASLEGKQVIVAPLVNPDSYFKRRPTRTNANGVDVNRNFPTKDFQKSAYKSWVNRYGKDKRRFPGHKPMSEPETIFQVNLIYRYKPNKIISVHAPLTMLDYDGPASEHTGGIVGSKANELLITMSEQAKGYRIKNYPFFPGSLGNFAGNERNIPTFTLELPTSDPAKTTAYWKLFKDSIHSAVMHEIKGEGFVALEHEDNPHQDIRSN